MNRLIKCFRNPQVWGFFLSIAVMALISIVFFYPDNFEGNSLQQYDMQQGAANGHEVQEYYLQTGEKALWTNSLFSGMPTFQISPSYPSDSLFGWLDKVYGLGLPSPSNLLFMMMFGFLILLFALGMRWYYALIGAVAWGFSSYFMIIIGAGHIWKFLALAHVPPTIGGLVLCYRRRYVTGAALVALFAMMQLNANHPQMSYYFAFVMVGLVIAYLIVAIKEKRVRQWGIATACVAGAGLLAVGANMPGLYNTYEYSKETKRTQSELTPLSSGGEEVGGHDRPTGGMSRSDIVFNSYGRSEMFSLLVPDIKGGATIRPEKGSHTPMTLDRLDGARDMSGDVQYYLQYFPQYFNDSEGTNGPVYVGAVICFLFLLGCVIVRGPVKWALVVLTILSVLLALGRNFSSLTDLMIYNFPLYNKFRAVESILVIAEFTMPLLAVMSLHRFFTTKDAWKVYRMPVSVAFAVTAVICLSAMLFPSVFGDAVTSKEQEILNRLSAQDPYAGDSLLQAIESLRYGMVKSDALRSLFFIVLSFLALWMYGSCGISKRLVLPALGFLVLADLYFVDKRYVSHDSFSSVSDYAYADPFAPDSIDEAIMRDTLVYRVMDVPGFDSPLRSYHHKMIGGYHAAKLNRYEDLIQRRLSYVAHFGYDPSLMDDRVVALYSPEEQAVIRELQAGYRVLDMLNARYIITGDQQRPVVVNTGALGNAWLVNSIRYVDNADAEMTAIGDIDLSSAAVADRKFANVLGRNVPLSAAGDTVYLTRYSPGKLEYRAKTGNGGLAVFSEIYFPWGWKATVDGDPVELGRVDYVLRAMRLPAGIHVIEMTFDPESLHVTAAVAYVCIILVYLLLMAGCFLELRRYVCRRD